MISLNRWAKEEQIDKDEQIVGTNPQIVDLKICQTFTNVELTKTLLLKQSALTFSNPYRVKNLVNQTSQPRVEQ